MNIRVRFGVLLALVAFASACPPGWTKENFKLKALETFLTCAHSKDVNLKECITLYKEEKYNNDEFKPCLSIATCMAYKSKVYDADGNLQWDEVDNMIAIVPDNMTKECIRLKGICKDKVSGTGEEMSKSGMNCILDNSEGAKELMNYLIKKLEG